MGDLRFHDAEGRFDLEAFEAHVEARVEGRPDLQQAQGLGTGAALALALAGLALLVRRAARRRDAAAPVAPPEAPGWTLLLPALLVLAFPGAGVTATRVLLDLGAPDTLAVRLAGGSLGLVLVAALGLAAASTRPGRLGALGLTPPAPLRAVGTGLVYLLMALPVVAGLQLASRALADSLGVPTTPNPAAGLYLGSTLSWELGLVAVIAVLLAPVSEELLFRGLLYSPLRRRYGRTAGVVISALIFSVVHPPVDMPAIFALGVVLALAYEHTGSLLAPLAAHAANNLYGMAALTLQRHLAWG
jgi:membrane protease YdiL (CAAX protease family)